MRTKKDNQVLFCITQHVFVCFRWMNKMGLAAISFSDKVQVRRPEPGRYGQHHPGQYKVWCTVLVHSKQCMV